MFLLAALYTFTPTLLAQASLPFEPLQNKGSRMNLYGQLLGSVELPETFRGYMTADYMER
jgi:hypothetical protein